MDADKLNRLQNKLVAKKFGYWEETNLKGNYRFIKGTSETQRTGTQRTGAQDNNSFSRESLTECLDRLNINNYY